jgi:protein-tyrosine phosphatase
VIDLHCHPLPRVDDGPASTKEALALLRAAAAGGTRTMVATPHVSGSYPRNRAEGVAAGVRALQAEADAAAIDIRLVAGAELELLHREMLHDDEMPGLRLGDGPYTLVELPFTAVPQFAEALLKLHGDVHPAILAHPERCMAFHQDPDLIARLVGRGMLVQVTAASIAGSYGPIVQRSAWSMFEQGLVHVVASDAHDAVRRPPSLHEPLEHAGMGELVATLCEDGPAAILAGERPAPAPPIKPSRAARRGRMRVKLRGR